MSSDVFTRSLAEIKRYEGYELDIELLSDRKVFWRNYHFTAEDDALAEKRFSQSLRHFSTRRVLWLTKRITRNVLW